MKFITFFLTVIKWLVVVYIVLWLSFTFVTDNQISCYIKSKVFQSQTNYDKIIILESYSSLDSLFKKNPNTEFYFASLYCSYCKNKLRRGSNFDSIERKNIIYLIVDNSFALFKISKILIKNKNISNIYYLNDDNFKGMYHTKGWSIVDKYLPNFKGKRNYFPFKLYSDSEGDIYKLE